jgi:hypothetical protein
MYVYINFEHKDGSINVIDVTKTFCRSTKDIQQQEVATTFYHASVYDGNSSTECYRYKKQTETDSLLFTLFKECDYDDDFIATVSINVFENIPMLKRMLHFNKDHINELLDKKFVRIYYDQIKYCDVYMFEIKIN